MSDFAGGSTTGTMVCKEDFRHLIEEYEREDTKREDLIKMSRDVLKHSKQAIFALLRKDIASARALLEDCSKVIETKLYPITDEHPSLRSTGMLVGALEEYAEACIFLHFLETRKLLPFERLKGLYVEEFLGGLMDCTGELNRFAVLRATEGDDEAVRQCSNFVGAVHEQMLLMDLRNSALRRKYDTLKYTDKKLDALVYELALAKRLENIKLPSMMMEDEPGSMTLGKEL